jgi:hypothetical protein
MEYESQEKRLHVVPDSSFAGGDGSESTWRKMDWPLRSSGDQPDAVPIC